MESERNEKRKRDSTTEVSHIFPRPYQDLIIQVHKFIIRVSANHPQSQIEVEGKIGQFIDKQTRQRFNNPDFTTEAIIPSNFHVFFKSDMTPGQHSHFNKILNGRVSGSKNARHIKYLHKKQTDLFYYCNDGAKLRQTVDGEVTDPKSAM